MTGRKVASFALIGLLLMVSLGMASFSSQNAAAATITVGPTGQYSSIQAAVDASNPGDTVNVSEGTYSENIVINKRINLTGNGSAVTSIRGLGTGSVILIMSDWVNITGFNVTGSGVSLYDAGITLIGANNCTIENTTISGNHFGLFLTACQGNKIHNNNFINNTCHAFDDGANTWSLSLPTGGNFWDDQELVDDDGNGVMDRAYSIPGGTNRDLKPWTNQTGWKYYEKAFNVDAISMMFIGMGVVFAILTILWVSTHLTGVVIQKYEASKAAKAKGGPGESEAVAAIAAAVETRRD